MLSYTHAATIHSNESQHLVGETEVARLRQQFSFVLQQALSFRTDQLCRHRGAPVGIRQLRSQGPTSLYAHSTKGETGSVGREGENGVGGRIGVKGGNGDGNRYVCMYVYMYGHHI